MAKLYFKYGAMNSGKTAILLQAAYNYEERGMKTYLIKPSCDTKGEDYLISRIGLKRKVDFKADKNDNLYDVIYKIKNNISSIFVDEAQFLTKRQVDELMQVTIDFNIPVLCYGLRTDFKTNGFEGAIRLLLVAHSIEEMKTICTCGKKAIFNARYINNTFVKEGEQIAIDKEDDVEYISLCASCYSKKVKNIKNNL